MSAAEPHAWVPVRWQGGPLEVQRRERDKTLPASPDLRETINRWYEPATLDLLRGTPINCLLVTWSADGDQTTRNEQQKLVGAYARAARERGIAVLGLVHSRSNPSSILEPAIEAGLSGLVLEGPAATGEFASELRQAIGQRATPFAIVSASSRDRLAVDADVLAIADASAPGVQELAEDAEATPSSEPWINFNSWLARSIRSSAGTRPIWFLNTLPDDAAGEDYLRAVADAAVGGARWVVSPGDHLRHGLRTNDEQAATTWRQIAAFLKFQQEHDEWFKLPPLAVSGFVQDSSAPDRDVPGEYLKLLIRRGIPVRVIERSRLNAAALDGLKALHAMDLSGPTMEERKLLTAFAEAGGVLVVGTSWEQVEIPANQEHASRPSGKGQVLVFQDGADPGELARTVVDALGRDELGVRLFRAASVLSHGSTSEAGKSVLIHLLNYASFPAESLLVRVDGTFRSVRLYTPGNAPEALSLDASDERVEVTVPRLPVYGVLLFER